MITEQKNSLLHGNHLVVWAYGRQNDENLDILRRCDAQVRLEEKRQARKGTTAGAQKTKTVVKEGVRLRRSCQIPKQASLLRAHGDNKPSTNESSPSVGKTDRGQILPQKQYDGKSFQTKLWDKHKRRHRTWPPSLLSFSSHVGANGSRSEVERVPVSFRDPVLILEHELTEIRID